MPLHPPLALADADTGVAAGGCEGGNCCQCPGNHACTALAHLRPPTIADRTAAAPLPQVLKTEGLPALSESDSRIALRLLARAYRRAAAAAPTRPHAWLLDTATGSNGSSVAGTPTAGRAGCLLLLVQLAGPSRDL